MAPESPLSGWRRAGTGGARRGGGRRAARPRPVARLPGGPGESPRRLRGAEDRGDEGVLDRPLARLLLRLPLREVPVRAGVRRVLQLRVRGTVRRVEVGAPAGDPGPQRLAGGGGGGR